MRQQSLVDVHVAEVSPLTPPDQFMAEFPGSEKATDTVRRGRRAISGILRGKDSRLMIIVGPCSIHDPEAALDYARRLAALSKKLEGVLLVMRVYFEKPRTVGGWKGMVSEPDPGNGFDVEKGLRMACQLLIEINELGIPVATEFLDPIVPQYLDRWISFGAIGARTTESQIHRQMASGLSMPVGFKNSTGGDVRVAADAIAAARLPSSFLGVDRNGRIAVIRTSGNHDCYLILRGGKRPNFHPRDVRSAIAMLDKTDATCGQINIIIDCSHANSDKDHAKQALVLRSVVRQRRAGNRRVVGVMLESNLHPGNQKLVPGKLQYGVSITDACIGWEETEHLLRLVQRSLN